MQYVGTKPRVMAVGQTRMLDEELGAENEAIRKQLRDAEILASYPGGIRLTPERKEELNKMKVGDWPNEWRDVDEPLKANDRQVAGEHYKNMRIQPWDVIDSLDHAQAIGFYRGNALKYIMRAGEKGPAREDYEKARHYLDKLLEIL